jgi:hypothetical protein
MAIDDAYGRMKSAPLTLTAADFDQLAAVSPRLEADGREAQRQAQLAIVRKSMPPATPKPVKTLVTRAALDKRTEMLIKVVAQGIKERLAPLEQRITDQDARILELEAQIATSKVTA